MGKSGNVKRNLPEKARKKELHGSPSKI